MITSCKNRKILLIAFFTFFIQSQASASASETVYTQACRVINEDDYVQYKIQSSLKDESLFVVSITAFEDENCVTPYLVIDRFFTIQSRQNEKINLKTEKIEYVSLSREVSEALNLAGYCGLKNWKTKIAQDVTGLKCDHYLQLKKSEIFYQILDLEDETLFYGYDLGPQDGRSEMNRPVRFDLPLTK